MTDTREERGFKPLNAGAFMNGLGPVEGKRAEDGGYICALQTGEDHANALGIVHGGVITALLDQVVAMSAWTAAERAPTVTVQMDTRFVSPARPGDRLTAIASLRERTGSMMFLDAEVKAGDRLVALATAVMKIARKAA